MVIEYTQRSSYTGLTYRVRCEGVATWADEPYPPGGTLRVLRNEAGQAIAGPHLDELLTWREVVA